MRRRILELARWAARWAGQWGRRRESKAKRAGRFGFEGLERREVLSSAAVTPFLEVSGQINTIGQTVPVQFRLDPTTVQGPPKSSTVLIGLMARPTSVSPVDPEVTRVQGPGGAVKPSSAGSNGRPFIVRLNVPRNGPTTYTAEVADTGNKTGGFIVDAFLPGDVNGDLRVDKSDLAALNASYGSRIGQARYNRAVDINHDGVVGCRDRWYLQKNMGASVSFVTNPTPFVTPAPAPVVAPVQATVTTVTPVTTVAPVTQAVAVTAPAPVTVAVAPTPVATQPANVVWIPVLASSVAAPTGSAPATGTMPVQAYYPTTTAGTTSPAPMVYTTAPGQTPTVYYSTPAGSTSTVTPVQTGAAVPSGPLYYAMNPTPSQGAQPAYYLTSSPLARSS